MPFYRSTDILYASLRATFGRIKEGSPDHLDGLKSLMASRMVIQMKCTCPAAQFTLYGRERPFRATYGAHVPSGSLRGPATPRADLTVELAADKLHLILLDELSIKKAVADGKIKVHGPVWKLKVLVDLIKGARIYHPDVLREQELT
jgi:hypothetical protein